MSKITTGLFIMGVTTAVYYFGHKWAQRKALEFINSVPDMYKFDTVVETTTKATEDKAD